MSEEKLFKDSFSIGTGATGGIVKVYFDDIRDEDTVKKIDRAIRIWKNATAISGRAK